MPMNQRTIGFSRAAAAALAFLSITQAHAFPTRPVTIVIGFASGGPSDLMVHAFSRKLEQHLGKPVVIENRAGAGGNIAGVTVARAAPDGHTLLLANTGILAANSSLYSKMSFEPERDFAPIALIGIQANVLVVHPSLPAHSVAEFLAHARAHPAKLHYSSGGIGSSPHLAAELLKAKTKIDLVHVPFRGTGPALQELLDGRVQMTLSSASAVMNHIQSGAVRALGVSTLTRTALLPDVPTIAQDSVPGYEAAVWHCLVAPAATPKEVLHKLVPRYFTWVA